MSRWLSIGKATHNHRPPPAAAVVAPQPMVAMNIESQELRATERCKLGERFPGCQRRLQLNVITRQQSADSFRRMKDETRPFLRAKTPLAILCCFSLLLVRVLANHNETTAAIGNDNNGDQPTPRTQLASPLGGEVNSGSNEFDEFKATSEDQRQPARPDEGMQVKYRFTFRVNGREFELAPPTTNRLHEGDSTATSTTTTTTVRPTTTTTATIAGTGMDPKSPAAPASHKDNRFGELAADFDTNGGGSDPGFGSGQQMWRFGNGRPRSPPPTVPRAATSGSSGAADHQVAVLAAAADDNKDERSQASASAARTNSLLVSQAKPQAAKVEQHDKEVGEDSNIRIISDWPRTSSPKQLAGVGGRHSAPIGPASKATTPPMTPMTAPAATASKPKSQSQAAKRFSMLLSAPQFSPAIGAAASNTDESKFSAKNEPANAPDGGSSSPKPSRPLPDYDGHDSSSSAGNEPVSIRRSPPIQRPPASSMADKARLHTSAPPTVASVPAGRAATETSEGRQPRTTATPIGAATATKATGLERAARVNQSGSTGGPARTEQANRAQSPVANSAARPLQASQTMTTQAAIAVGPSSSTPSRGLADRRLPLGAQHASGRSSGSWIAANEAHQPATTSPMEPPQLWPSSWRRQKMASPGDDLRANATRKKAPIVSRDLSRAFSAPLEAASSFHQQQQASALAGPTSPNWDLSTTYSGPSGPTSNNRATDKLDAAASSVPRDLLLSSKASGANVGGDSSLHQPAAYDGYAPNGAAGGRFSERMTGAGSSNSVVRTGPIITHPFAISAASQLQSLMPAVVLLAAQAQVQAQTHDAGQRQQQQAQAQSQANQFRSKQQQGQQQQQSQQNVSPPAGPANSLHQNPAGPEQMVTTSNQLSAVHLGVGGGQPPVSTGAISLGTSESNSYNSIANLQEYSDRPGGGGGDSSNDGGASGNRNEPPTSSSHQVPISSMLADDSRGLGDSDSMGPLFSESVGTNMRSLQNQNSNADSANGNSNSRSSIGEFYARPEHKSTRDTSGAIGSAGSGVGGVGGSEGGMGSRVGAGGSHYTPMRVSDSFEDMATGGLSAGDFERDLADLDEEFNRQASFRTRPSSLAAIGLANPLMSDSYMSYSPERFETGARSLAGRYSARRPPAYSYYPNDYLQMSSTAGGSLASSAMLPRTEVYQQARGWPTATAAAAMLGGYSDSADAASALWPEVSNQVDFGPLASFLAPAAQQPQYAAYATGARWPYSAAAAAPRYQRLAAYSAMPYALATSASEQHLQPAAAAAAYNLAYSTPTAPTGLPATETLFAISPLAADAAAAASALVDKSRQHQHHQGGGGGSQLAGAWYVLPARLAGQAGQGGQAGSQAAASTAAASATAPSPTAYIQRASPFAASAYGSAAVPIYALTATRPAGSLTGASASLAPSLIPYLHATGGSVGAPTAFIAYHPRHAPAAGALMQAPAGSLLTAASLAYPALRLPIGPIGSIGALQGTYGASMAGAGRPSHSIAIGAAPARAVAIRPFYADLQLAETSGRSKTSYSGNSNGAGAAADGRGASGLVKAGSLTAMAKNLTKKMFGSASQVRAQHVAPPTSFIGASGHQSSSSSLFMADRGGSGQLAVGLQAGHSPVVRALAASRRRGGSAPASPSQQA